MFSQGAEKFYSTYNRSVKIMADLPYATHRYLIEPVSGQSHMSLTLIKNFINFISKVRDSPKLVLRQLYSIAKADVRTVTGSNLRHILLLTSLSRVDDIQPSTVDNIRYNKIMEQDKWRVHIIKEALDIRNGDITAPEGWTKDELNDILNFACTQ